MHACESVCVQIAESVGSHCHMCDQEMVCVCVSVCICACYSRCATRDEKGQDNDDKSHHKVIGNHIEPSGDLVILQCIVLLLLVFGNLHKHTARGAHGHVGLPWISVGGEMRKQRKTKTKKQETKAGKGNLQTRF